MSAFFAVRFLQLATLDFLFCQEAALGFLGGQVGSRHCFRWSVPLVEGRACLPSERPDRPITLDCEVMRELRLVKMTPARVQMTAASDRLGRPDENH